MYCAFILLIIWINSDIILSLTKDKSYWIEKSTTKCRITALPLWLRFALFWCALKPTLAPKAQLSQLGNSALEWTCMRVGSGTKDTTYWEVPAPPSSAGVLLALPTSPGSLGFPDKPTPPPHAHHWKKERKRKKKKTHKKGELWGKTKQWFFFFSFSNCNWEISIPDKKSLHYGLYLGYVCVIFVLWAENSFDHKHCAKTYLIDVRWLMTCHLMLSLWSSNKKHSHDI